MKNLLIVASVSVLLASCQQSGNNGRANGGRGAGARPGAEQIFSRLDADQSGGVSYNEFQLPPKRGGQTQAEPSTDAKQKRFSRIDTNSDGQVSLSEFQAARKQGPPKKQ